MLWAATPRSVTGGLGAQVCGTSGALMGRSTQRSSFTVSSRRSSGDHAMKRCRSRERMPAVSVMVRLAALIQPMETR